MKKRGTLSIPVFVHVPDDEFIQAPLSQESLNEVTQWATTWSKAYDSSIAEQARNVVKALDSFLNALDKKGKEKAQDSPGSTYLAGLLGQAEAILANGSAIKRNVTARTKSRKK